MASADISVVVPTYNPQERIFARVLAAIDALEVPERTVVEYVLVDNRSDPPLGGMRCVQQFLATHGSARLVREDAQGLTFARLAGIRETTGGVVVVFDDDNLPDRAYLRVAAACREAAPWVGVWGAGNIDVELLDPVPAWLQERAKQAHNQRRCDVAQYGCVPGSWQPFYPIGMGQVIRRDVAETYRAAVEGGALNATDRKAGSFASAGDIQIVWQAIGMGAAAGVHPGLRVTHLIPGQRATVAYMKRLAFGCGVSYYPALAQSFAADAATRRRVPTTRQHVAGLIRFAARRVMAGGVRFLSIDFANALGLACGRVAAAGYGADHWTFRLARRLGLT